MTRVAGCKAVYSYWSVHHSVLGFLGTHINYCVLILELPPFNVQFVQSAFVLYLDLCSLTHTGYTFGNIPVILTLMKKGTQYALLTSSL